MSATLFSNVRVFAADRSTLVPGSVLVDGNAIARVAFDDVMLDAVLDVSEVERTPGFLSSIIAFVGPGIPRGSQADIALRQVSAKRS